MSEFAISKEATAPDWWGSRRLFYNGILLAGAGFSVLCLFVVATVFGSRLPCLEITVFTIFFGAVAFAMGLVGANICFGLGALTERLVKPRNVPRFRRVAFAAGVAFSLLLVFMPVLGNLAVVAFGPPELTSCE
jgi:hypothetical protein